MKHALRASSLRAASLRAASLCALLAALALLFAGLSKASARAESTRYLYTDSEETLTVLMALPTPAATAETAASAAVDVAASLSYPVCAVAAPEKADGTVPLFKQADTGSDVLMEYYSGARLTVLRPAANGFWMVQAGEKGAAIMGYMRETDLKLGEAAQRQVPLSYMELQFNREAPIYAYCDTGAPVVGTCDTIHTYYAMSRSDKQWVQLIAPPVSHVWEQQNRATAGFVFMETGLGRGYWHDVNSTSRVDSWRVDPLPGEWTEAEAVEFAIEQLIFARDNENYNYIYLAQNPDAQPFFYESSLRQMAYTAELVYNYNFSGSAGSVTWSVYFYDGLRENMMHVKVYSEHNEGYRVDIIFVQHAYDPNGNVMTR